MYDIFLICPVRNATEEQKQRMVDYIAEKEGAGLKVYYPARDTNQETVNGGYDICTANKEGILSSKEVHIFWDDKSSGSLFDLGMAFCAGKKLVVVNPEDIHLENKKSFHNMIDFWRKLPEPPEEEQ